MVNSIYDFCTDGAKLRWGRFAGEVCRSGNQWVPKSFDEISAEAGFYDADADRAIFSGKVLISGMDGRIDHGKGTFMESK